MTNLNYTYALLDNAKRQIEAAKERLPDDTTRMDAESLLEQSLMRLRDAKGLLTRHQNRLQILKSNDN